VQAAWAEADTGPGTPRHVEVVEELAAELCLFSGWLGLDEVVVVPRGDLAPSLVAVLTRTRALGEGRRRGDGGGTSSWCPPPGIR